MDANQPNHEAALAALSTKVRKLTIYTAGLAIVTLTAIVALGFVFWRKQRTFEKQQSDLTFSLASSDYSRVEDIIYPNVNTIQFLRRGYSIDFDSVKYTQDGLVLAGTIGNPTELNITSLAVTFAARPSFYSMREKWEKNGISPSGYFWIWESDWDIGKGQTTVGMLSPGSSAPFSVTIPNVKQTKDSIEIDVSFSGERYGYLR